MSPGRSVVNCEIQETTCKKMFIDKNTTNKNKNNFNNNTNNKTVKIDKYVFLCLLNIIYLCHAKDQLLCV